MSRDQVGTIYLLHFDQAVADHARHYLGWTSDLDARLDAHREGRGARLMEVCRERGITWHVSRTWSGTRDRERALKDRAESPRLCPDCTPSPFPTASGRSGAARPEPEPEPEADPEPEPEAEAVSVWPGRPDLEAAADGYAKYWDLTDALASQWQAEAAAAASAAHIEVPGPREPEPEPELEMEI